MKRLRCDVTKEKDGVPYDGNVYEVTSDNPTEVLLILYGEASTQDLHMHALGDKMMLLTAMMAAVERLSEGMPNVHVRQIRLDGKDDDHE